jgi:hypothetical protein
MALVKEAIRDRECTFRNAGLTLYDGDKLEAWKLVVRSSTGVLRWSLSPSLVSSISDDNSFKIKTFDAVLFCDGCGNMYVKGYDSQKEQRNRTRAMATVWVHDVATRWR